MDVLTRRSRRRSNRRCRSDDTRRTGGGRWPAWPSWASSPPRLGLPATPPAGAAPGDAAALGLSVELGAEVGGLAVLASSASAGSATAPPGGGERLASVDASGTGVAGGAAVVDVSADQRPDRVERPLDDQRPRPRSARRRRAGRRAGRGHRHLPDVRRRATARPRSPAADCGCWASRCRSRPRRIGDRVERRRPRRRRSGPGPRSWRPWSPGPRSTSRRRPGRRRSRWPSLSPSLRCSGAPQSVDVGQVTLARVSCERPVPPPLSLASLDPPAGPAGRGHDGDDHRHRIRARRHHGRLRRPGAGGRLGVRRRHRPHRGDAARRPLAGPGGRHRDAPRPRPLVLPGAYTYLPEEPRSAAPRRARRRSSAACSRPGADGGRHDRDHHRPRPAGHHRRHVRRRARHRRDRRVPTAPG